MDKFWEMIAGFSTTASLAMLGFILFVIGLLLYFKFALPIALMVCGGFFVLIALTAALDGVKS